MPGSSILPVALHKGKLYFLFGKENPMEDSAHGFSDFGGGIDAGEKPFETAMREGSEELTGFLGTPDQIRQHVRRTGGTFAFTHTNAKDSALNYTVHVMCYPYDPELPVYYNNNHRFLWDRMNRKLLNSTKLFEKIEIRWFCEDELQKCMPQYRPFYREIVATMLQKLPEIRQFIRRSQGKLSSAAAASTRHRPRRGRHRARRSSTRRRRRRSSV
jgi:8-oxo-dGTP pyrophosphatase MutT (NUDIX family)